MNFDNITINISSTMVDGRPIGAMTIDAKGLGEGQATYFMPGLAQEAIAALLPLCERDMIRHETKLVEDLHTAAGRTIAARPNDGWREYQLNKRRGAEGYKPTAVELAPYNQDHPDWVPPVIHEGNYDAEKYAIANDDGLTIPPHTPTLEDELEIPSFLRRANVLTVVADDHGPEGGPEVMGIDVAWPKSADFNETLIRVALDDGTDDFAPSPELKSQALKDAFNWDEFNGLGCDWHHEESRLRAGLPLTAWSQKTLERLADSSPIGRPDE